MRLRNASLLLSLVLSTGLRAADALTPSGAQLLPADATIALTIPELEGLVSALAKSPYGKLWQDPETQQFATPILAEFQKLYTDWLNDHPNLEAPAWKDLPSLLKGELVFSLSGTGGKGRENFRLAWHPGDPAPVKALLKTLFGNDFAEDHAFAITDAGEKGAQLIFEKGWLLAAGNPAELEELRARVKGDEAKLPALSTTHRWQNADRILAGPMRLAGGTPHLTLCIDTAHAFTEFLECIPADIPLQAALKALRVAGLDNIDALGWQLATRNEALSMSLAVSTQGAPKGALAEMCTAKAFDPKHLALVPEKSTFFAAWPIFPLAPEPGVGLIFDTGSNFLFGLVPDYVVGLKTENANLILDQVKQTVADAADAEFKPVFKQVDSPAGKIDYLDFGVPFLPAAHANKDLFLMSLNLAGLRESLRGAAAKHTLADNADFQAAVARVTGQPYDPEHLPAGLAYFGATDAARSVDFGALAKVVFDIIKMPNVLWMLEGGMEEELGRPIPEEDEAVELSGLLKAVDFSLFPRPETIQKYNRPHAGYWQAAEEGSVYRQEVGLPGAGSIASPDALIFLTTLSAAVLGDDVLMWQMAGNESDASDALDDLFGAQHELKKQGAEGYAQSILGNQEPGEGEKVEIPEPAAADTEAVATLAPKLASDHFEEREQAAADLLKLGPKAIKPLEKLVLESKDAEIKTRAQAIVARLKGGLFKHLVRDTRNGLYSSWKKDGEPGLVSKELAQAEAGVPHAAPFHGYYFKVLTAQGADAKGGAKSYFDKPTEADPTRRKMSEGFAFVAYPARYGKTGKLTYIVNQDGTVYSRDLGPDTEKAVNEMQEFNPGKDWKEEDQLGEGMPAGMGGGGDEMKPND